MSDTHAKDGSAKSLRYLFARLREHEYDGWADYVEAAADRLEVLEAALTKIAGGNPHNNEWWREEAREALQGSVGRER